VVDDRLSEASRLFFTSAERLAATVGWEWSAKKRIANTHRPIADLPDWLGSIEGRLTPAPSSKLGKLAA
jgi:hypothetical protein